jgi:hypothetical protein
MLNPFDFAPDKTGGFAQAKLREIISSFLEMSLRAKRSNLLVTGAGLEIFRLRSVHPYPRDEIATSPYLTLHNDIIGKG